MSDMVRQTSLVLMLARGALWMWCASLADGSSTAAVFSPFGSDEGDNVVTDDDCDGPVNIPFNVFGSTTLFVSETLHGHL